MARDIQQTLPGAANSARTTVRVIRHALLISLRPEQWTKNLIVFGALIFGGELFEATIVARAGGGFLAFCALSSAGYLFNDVIDRDADRVHPLKSQRPVASGALPVPVALAAAAALGLLAVGGAWALWPSFGFIAVGYAALFCLYSTVLKHIVIVDVLTIAVGFVLRAVGGAVVITVPISPWLLVCTILLALFLALSKRRHELVLLADEAGGHRPILDEYNPYLLDQMIAVVTASTLMAYSFYAISPETVEKFGTDLLSLTIPFPLYGIFRYLYLVHRKEGGGSPAEILLADRPLLLCIGLWVLTVVVVTYTEPLVGRP